MTSLKNSVSQEQRGHQLCSLCLRMLSVAVSTWFTLAPAVTLTGRRHVYICSSCVLRRSKDRHSVTAFQRAVGQWKKVQTGRLSAGAAAGDDWFSSWGGAPPLQQSAAILSVFQYSSLLLLLLLWLLSGPSFEAVVLTFIIM